MIIYIMGLYEDNYVSIFVLFFYVLFLFINKQK